MHQKTGCIENVADFVQHILVKSITGFNRIESEMCESNMQETQRDTEE